jgi:hypothetical protein
MRRVCAAIIGLGGVIATEAMAVCGDGTLDGNEACDSSPCCTMSCQLAPNGTSCGAPPNACRLASACFDFTCFEGDVLRDGTPCDDGDPCTVDDRCLDAACVPRSQRCDARLIEPIGGIRIRKVLKAGGTESGFLSVECSVGPTNTGSTCAAAAFLPSPQSDAAVRGVFTETPPPEVACDFTRQLTRTAARPFRGASATVKLKLTKLGRRLLRMIASPSATMTVCTKIDFANGDSVTLVHTVMLR